MHYFVKNKMFRKHIILISQFIFEARKLMIALVRKAEQ
jgi:hypothetical protein